MISETEKLAARRAALAKLLRLAYELGREDERERPGKDCSRDFAEDAMKLSGNLPTVEVAPVVHANIIPCECEQSGQWARCSLCHKIMRLKYKYCPNCGAKMNLKVTP